MSRELPEWIAANDDQAIPARVKIRVFDLFNGNCAICTNRVVVAQFDHAIALINGEEHRESNLQLLCVPCHRVKTRTDVAEKSVTARKRAKHLGIKKPRTITRWRRFDGSIREAGRERS
jgi:5-methylcytosine-specific restriction endonuclease McrA